MKNLVREPDEPADAAGSLDSRVEAAQGASGRSLARIPHHGECLARASEGKNKNSFITGHTNGVAPHRREEHSPALVELTYNGVIRLPWSLVLHSVIVTDFAMARLPASHLAVPKVASVLRRNSHTEF